MSNAFITWFYCMATIAPRADKMNQIARCDWLPEWARLSYLVHSGLPVVSNVKNFPESQIINHLLTKLQLGQDGWILPRSCFGCLTFMAGPRLRLGLMNTQKKLHNTQPSWRHAWSITHMYLLPLVWNFQWLRINCNLRPPLADRLKR